jgi:uncharacterized protein with HEPN domain
MSRDPQRLPDYLGHILEAIERIQAYVADVDEVGFLSSKIIQDAVIRNLEVIGEASRNIERVHPEFAAAHPELPLALANDMRNALAHGYFKVDLEIVWKTIQNNLPDLHAQITEVSATLSPNNDNKPPMFGPSGVFDPATYKPCSGKTFWMAATDVSSLADKQAAADTLVGNCTTNLPFKFDPKDNGHYLMFGSTREGMATRPSLLPLSAPSQFAADVLMAIGCQRDVLESDGVSLAALSRILGMKSSPEDDRRILDALLELKGLVPALSELRYSEADGLVRAGDVHQ